MPDQATDDAIPLADHDEIGRKVLGQPWAIQSAIVTIAAHCTVLTDKHPTGDVADLAGCISQTCLELANALAAPAQCDVQSVDAMRAALVLAEDILSRAPFSTSIWPNGMHPQRGIAQIRAALALPSAEQK